ncbi:MAG TPA: hypothetical protein PLO62_10060 [Candidatus Hydrogenedentes bacterium]|nr:hypothetical protein [Candidatus Hydrogenedentota bacterium]HOS02043.1 hypothetical protein [Candidatus Hydrogenedentota bacterium]
MSRANFIRMAASVAVWTILAAIPAFATIQYVNVSDGSAQGSANFANVDLDFCHAFDGARATNAGEVRCIKDGRRESSRLPGVYLHPTASLEDAVLAYDGVMIFPSSPEKRSFLVFWIGIREGVPWSVAENPPNGVRFRVTVEGATVFEEELKASAYRCRAVNMEAYVGKTVRIEFRTNAIDGDSRYDWAVFGDPLLVSLPPSHDNAGAAPGEETGVALAQVRCAVPAHVTLRMGDQTEEADLPEGERWLPIFFKKNAPVTLEPASNDVRLVSVAIAPFAAKLVVEDVALDSPFLTVDRPYDVLMTVRNAGRGVYPGGATAALTDVSGNTEAASPAAPESSDASLTQPIEESQEIAPMEPGERRVIYWPGRKASSPGDRTIRTRLVWKEGAPPVYDDRRLAVHVFPPEPARTSDRPSQAETHLLLGDAQAMVATPWARLMVVADKDKHAYLIAEAWNGATWQRAATLYPLARAVIAQSDEAGARQELAIRLNECTYENDRRLLIVGAEAKAPGGETWPIRILIAPDKENGRFGILSRFGAPRPTDLVAFSGPEILAGDRAFGANKTGALFPGLEFLEREESSSSERDLARPYNDRRVPAVHKITTPLMAVQGDDVLIAWMWDIRQPWAHETFYPAARFVSPAPDMGLRCTRLSLFVPSVGGEYVPENAIESVRPHHMERTEHVEIAGLLVIDPKARHAGDLGNPVAAPHACGLLLESMRQYFETFGMPEPSAPPRSWNDTRALCREAYLRTLWNETPPGWSACKDGKPGAFPGYAALLELDRRAGVNAETDMEMTRRIDAAIGHVVQKEGPDRLWTSAGSRILLGEAPFLFGRLPENIAAMCDAARATLAQRENGPWVWRPESPETAALGESGDATLSQAAQASFLVLRAARFSGDPELARQGLDAMRQMERHDVPRGAQSQECPLRQPDMIASAQAVRAYCEAYRLTGDPAHLVHARYWAWTGLPFLYTWSAEGRPAMLYNSIGILGSTFFHRSWIGLPVIRSGLIYAYALQDLAEFDDSFPWRAIAQGITSSAMHQQYSDGPSTGCVPDSWDMVRNAPNPADLNPGDILANGLRLNGVSPEPSWARVEAPDGSRILVNAAATILRATRDAAGAVHLELKASAPGAGYLLVAPIAEPKAVTGSGPRVQDSAVLAQQTNGWLYDPKLRAVTIKRLFADAPAPIVITP